MHSTNHNCGFNTQDPSNLSFQCLASNIQLRPSEFHGVQYNDRKVTATAHFGNCCIQCGLLFSNALEYYVFVKIHEKKQSIHGAADK
jgi:hypothetical protein